MASGGPTFGAGKVAGARCGATAQGPFATASHMVLAGTFKGLGSATQLPFNYPLPSTYFALAGSLG